RWGGLPGCWRRPAAGGADVLRGAVALPSRLCRGRSRSADENSARECGGQGQETADLGLAEAVERLDVRPGPRPRTGENVRLTVVVEVGHPDAHPAEEARVVSKEAGQQGAVHPTEGPDVGRRAR